MDDTQEKVWITPKEASVLMDNDPRSVTRLAFAGELKWKRRGGRSRKWILVKRASVVAYMAEK